MLTIYRSPRHPDRYWEWTYILVSAPGNLPIMRGQLQVIALFKQDQSRDLNEDKIYSHTILFY